MGLPARRGGYAWTASALLVFSILVSPCARAASVWVGDGSTLRHIDPGSNAVTVSLPLGAEPKALATDASDGSVWVLSGYWLRRFDPAGIKLKEFDLRTFASGLNKPKRLAVNPYDRSLWIGAENRLLHLSAEGTKLQTWTPPEELKAIALDVDESLWVLTDKNLIHLSPTAQELGRRTLSDFMSEPKHLAVDGLGSVLWVATEHRLYQLNTLNLGATPRTLALSPSGNESPEIEALAIHPLFGTLYLADERQLYFVDRAGLLVKTVDLAALKLGEAESLAFDPASSSLWLGGERFLARFTSNGEYQARIALTSEAEAIGVSPSTLKPALTLQEPADGALTNNPRPPINLQFGARCNADPCTLPSTYYDALNLDASLNGAAIGPQFLRSHTEASYLPASRLPEGENRFTTQAKDLFGHASNTVESRFTVDTTPPKFLGVTPPDGSQLSSATITIGGSIDDPMGNVSLFDSSGTLLCMGSVSFSFLSTLKAGENQFSLLARDPAGNEAQFPLRLTYSTGALQILNLQSGTLISGTSVSVIGTFDGPPGSGVTVNGVAATLVGNKFVANVPLAPGENILTVVVTSPDGEIARQTVVIKADGTSNVIGVAQVAPPGAGVRTVAGNGVNGFGVDGTKAINSPLGYPLAVAWGADGRLYFSDYGSPRVRRINTGGVLATVAGSDAYGWTGDGGPAELALLDYIYRLVFGPDGSLYIAEGTRVRRVRSNGIIERIAGKDWFEGVPDYSGDGGLAVDADLSNPEGLAVAQDGTLYISDTGNARIRKVDSKGIITTIAGTGTQASAGDGGPAMDASFYYPGALALGKDGSLYVAECYSSVIRRISPDGTVHRVAGTGVRGYAGDGGPATGATLNCPQDILFDSRGNLLVADGGNSVIRRIDTSGNIATVGGVGAWGFNGDGAAPDKTAFDWPVSLTLAPDGNLFIADSGNLRLRAFNLNMLDGVAPTDAALKLVVDPSLDIARIEIDFDGDGIVDLVTTDLTAPWLYRYPAPGIYEARITLIDKAGNRREIRHTVVVRDTAAMDATLKAVYAGMLSRLRSQNIEGALNYVSGGMREKYRAVFEALKTNLPTVVDQLGAIQGGAIGEEIAEYVIVRSQGTESRAFLVYFLRGEDGVWRIDGM